MIDIKNIDYLRIVGRVEVCNSFSHGYWNIDGWASSKIQNSFDLLWNAVEYSRQKEQNDLHSSVFFVRHVEVAEIVHWIELKQTYDLFKIN